MAAGLGFLIYKNRYVLTSFGGSWGKRSGPQTTVVMGMDVRPESLPDDVADAARRAWRDGDTHLALSLLYRGSIAWLIHSADLPIIESDTEGDCLVRVRGILDSGVEAYFSELTRERIAEAYGQQTPEDETMAALCDRWPFAKNRSIRGRGGV